MSTSMQDRKAAALIALAANFSREISPALLGIWLDMLKPYGSEQVEAAVREVMRTYEFKTMPPFAILQKALDRICGAVPQDRALPMMASAEWANVLEEIRRCGSYREPKLHPTTAWVLRSMGGWAAACQWDESKLEWRRKEFIEAFCLAHGFTALMDGGAVAISGFTAAPMAAGRVLDGMYANAAALPELEHVND